VHERMSHACMRVQLLFPFEFSCYLPVNT